jgi:RNA polymerase sigma-70 factor (ECF subfamily)
MAESDFSELIARVKAGDRQAAAELVHRYEPTIRLMVRRRLTNPKLRRFLDTMDICQSVLAKFFQAAASDQVALETPRELMNLLATMTKNKIISHTRKAEAARRDPKQGTVVAGDGSACVAPGLTPSQQVSREELERELRNKLTDEERLIADMRAAGRSWADIAARVGGSPDAIRMQHTRTIARVARHFGLENNS